MPISVGHMRKIGDRKCVYNVHVVFIMSISSSSIVQYIVRHQSQSKNAGDEISL